MNPRPLWRRKRIVLPLLLLAALLAAAGVAIRRSSSSAIILYNQTGEPLGPLLLRACGQTTTVHRLDDEESFRWRLHPVLRSRRAFR